MDLLALKYKGLIDSILTEDDIEFIENTLIETELSIALTVQYLDTTVRQKELLRVIG